MLPRRGRATVWQWLGLCLLCGGLGCGVLAFCGCERTAPPGPSPAPEKSESISPETAANSAMRWREVAVESGIEFQYRNGEESNQNSIVESVGGGLGWLDYDRDGRLDLVCPGGGLLPRSGAIEPRPTGLFRQRSEWQFVPVSEPAAVGPSGHYTHGCAVADFNSDGFPDLYITGYGGTTLQLNLGDGTWTETARAAGVWDDRFSTSAAWGDLDADGLADLYVAHYVDWSWSNHPACEGPGGVADVCPPRRFEGLDDRLYRNAGDGGFVETGRLAGLEPVGKGLGVVIGDADLDGDSDLYVANDTTENRYYLNQTSERKQSGWESPARAGLVAGTAGDPQDVWKGLLAENGLVQGVALDDRAVANGSMGVDFGDYNGDGWPDLWVANYEQELSALYRNEGRLGFQYASREAGISELGELFVGFGTLFGDFDLDGDEDLFVSNGHVIQTARLSPIRQVPLVLVNGLVTAGSNSRSTTPRFQRAAFPAGDYLGEPHLGRGVAGGDVDGDGDLDLAISHNNEPVAVLRNEATGRGVTVQLVGTASNRDAIGAIGEWQVGDEPLVRKLVKGGRSYLSASCYRLQFSWPEPILEAEEQQAEGTKSGGLPARKRPPGRLTVRWPSGKVTELTIDPTLGPGEVVVVIEAGGDVRVRP
jgi:enediyne biosynthesis protein E4